jgi:hypothetical protein
MSLQRHFALWLLIIFMGCKDIKPKQNKIVEPERNILGAWEYIESSLNGKKLAIGFNVHCPVPIIEFYQCDLSRYASGYLLGHICSRTYNLDNTMIDQYELGVENRRSDTSQFWINNFGQKYRSDYFLISLDSQFMTIADNRVYKIDGKEYVYVCHKYKKKKGATVLTL